MRNPRVRWRSDALEHPTPQPVLPPVASPQKMCLQLHHHGLHLCQSPVKRRRCNNLSHLTLICNLSFHRHRPQQMMIPCHFLTPMIHHSLSTRFARASDNLHLTRSLVMCLVITVFNNVHTSSSLDQQHTTHTRPLRHQGSEMWLLRCSSVSQPICASAGCQCTLILVCHVR